MARLASVEDLNRLREEAKSALKSQADAGTTIIVGMGTCGIAAGARGDHAVTESWRTGFAPGTSVGYRSVRQEPLMDISRLGRHHYANVNRAWCADRRASGERAHVKEWALDVSR
jgi:NADP-reducing hydrogenase subunit HndB